MIDQNGVIFVILFSLVVLINKKVMILLENHNMMKELSSLLLVIEVYTKVSQ